MKPTIHPGRLTRLLRRALVCAALPATLACAQEAAAPTPPITSAATDAFWIGDFAALERQNADYRKPGRFDPDGSSQLDQFRAGLGQVINNKVTNAEAYLSELDRLTLEWATAHPASAIAHGLHARALVAHGWSYRGGDYIHKVPPEALKQFQAYLLRAVKYLETHAAVALTDSYSHLVLLKIGTALGWDKQQMAAILADGLKRNPDDISLYSEMLVSLMPKWGGDLQSLDGFIRYAAEQTEARFGSGMYAELYSNVADEFGHGLFDNSHAEWPRMKQAYEDMFARFPTNPARLNRYAYMACVAKDKPVFTALLGKLGSTIHTNQWGANPERNLEACRRWGAQP